MNNIFEFLNQQSDGRLILFAIVFVASVYYVMQAVVYIFRAIFNKPVKKSKKKKKNEKVNSNSEL